METNECDIIKEILTFYGINIYWTTPYGCFDQIGVNAKGNIVIGVNNKVTELRIREQILNKPFNSRIFELSSLQHLSFAESGLTGEIPDEFSKLPNLKTLSLRGSNFSGSIPKSISTLTNLENLFLCNNNLKNNIGDSLKNLKNLKYLEIQNNDLSGPIPDYIGEYSGLNVLNLSNNRFEGKIPSSFKNLKNLTNFDASNLPNISGPVPFFTSNTCSFNGSNVCYNEGEQPVCATSLNVCAKEETVTDKKGKDDSNSKGYIIGGIVILAIVIFAVLFYFKKRKSNNKVRSFIPPTLTTYNSSIYSKDISNYNLHTTDANNRDNYDNTNDFDTSKLLINQNLINNNNNNLNTNYNYLTLKPDGTANINFINNGNNYLANSSFNYANGANTSIIDQSFLTSNYSILKSPNLSMINSTDSNSNLSFNQNNLSFNQNNLSFSQNLSFNQMVSTPPLNSQATSTGNILPASLTSNHNILDNIPSSSHQQNSKEEPPPYVEYEENHPPIIEKPFKL
ncbi:L domain-like protein [Neocallimastix lanati (nom. inval.)]|nr:L domain-like protein [Neocallimastix sp. JGI-2020a]